MYKNVIQFLLYASLAVPALPLAFFPFFQPYVFGKTVLFEILVEAAALLFLFQLFQGHPLDNPRVSLGKRIGIALLLFLFFATLSTGLSADPVSSFWGSSARMDGLFTLLHFAAFFFILIHSVHTEKAWLSLVRFSVSASVFAALWGLAQWFSEKDIISTIGNPAYLAVYLLFHIFFALYCAQKAQTREHKTLWVLVAVLEIIVVLLTNVRAAALGLALGGIIACAPFFRNTISTRKGIAALVLALFLAPLFLSSPFFSKLSSAPSESATIASRLYIWEQTYKQIFGYAPTPNGVVVWGHGAAQLEIASPHTNEAFDKPHNIFLEILYSFGILGLGAYVYLLVAVGGAAARHKEKYLFFGLLSGYLVFLFFFFDTLASLLPFFFLLAFLARASETEFSNGNSVSTTPPRSDLIRLGVVVTLTVALFSVFHFKPLYSAYFAHRYFTLTHQTGEASPELKSEALRYPSFNTPFIERAIFLTEQNQRK